MAQSALSNRRHLCESRAKESRVSACKRLHGEMSAETNLVTLKKLRGDGRWDRTEALLFGRARLDILRRSSFILRGGRCCPCVLPRHGK